MLRHLQAEHHAVRVARARTEGSSELALPDEAVRELFYVCDAIDAVRLQRAGPQRAHVCGGGDWARDTSSARAIAQRAEARQIYATTWGANAERACGG